MQLRQRGDTEGGSLGEGGWVWGVGWGGHYRPNFRRCTIKAKSQAPATGLAVFPFTAAIALVRCAASDSPASRPTDVPRRLEERHSFVHITDMGPEEIAGRPARLANGSTSNP